MKLDKSLMKEYRRNPESFKEEFRELRNRGQIMNALNSI